MDTLDIPVDEGMWKDKTIVYVDMDFTLCDYGAGFRSYQRRYPDLKFPQSVPGFYESLAPLDGAVETYRWFHEHPDLALFVLTAPSIMNPHSYSEKRLWIERHLGMDVVKRLIISPHKGLNKGHYLIDDRACGQGQDDFEGELIQFGTEAFPDWASVRAFFVHLLTVQSGMPQH